jgi:hypothetical protein
MVLEVFGYYSGVSAYRISDEAREKFRALRNNTSLPFEAAWTLS